jgi:hypothetical protein
MVSIAQKYTKDIYDDLQYRAIWLPSTPISVGSIVESVDGVFRHIGTVTDRLGIPIREEVYASSPISFQSRGGVEIKALADVQSAEVLSAFGNAKAGMLINFTWAGASIVSLTGCCIRRIANQYELEQELKDKADHNWKKNYGVVTELIEAERGIILVCEDAQGQVGLTAQTNLGQVNFNLGDASADLKIVYQKGKIFSQIGATRIRPLFHGVKMTGGLFRLLAVGSLGDDEENADDGFESL